MVDSPILHQGSFSFPRILANCATPCNGTKGKDTKGKGAGVDSGFSPTLFLTISVHSPDTSIQANIPSLQSVK